MLGKGKVEELAALTGGPGVVGSMADLRKSKTRERSEDAVGKKPNAQQIEPGSPAAAKPDYVIVDHDISPGQARKIERATGAQVLDRTGVIVEIFHRHAHSREAKLQVEMARLKYIGPRLRESSAGGERRQGYGAGESDLELVVDASDLTYESQLEVTRNVLHEIGAEVVASRLLLNKIDRVNEADRATLRAKHPDAILLSAESPADVAALRETIIAFFEGAMVEEEFVVPYAKQGLLSDVYESAQVLSENYDTTGRIIKVRGIPGAIARLRRTLSAS